ncbi:MAG: hypothetical protein VX278_06795, partial [Myxococcota bacterium]|nr:hypothetical protein [Myxococcota bacterium]
ADWIVLYIGHNDLTADNPYTRLERETRSKSLGRRLGRLARQSHLIIGADLLLRSFQKRQETIDRPPLGPDGKPMRSQVFAQDNPYAVPLSDAEQNILSIAKMAEKYDANLLLVAQHIAQKSFNDLSEYWAMEKRLASNNDRIYFFDPTPTLKRYPDSLLLVDNNHFSKRGHIELSRLLSTEIGRLLTDNQ